MELSKDYWIKFWKGTDQGMGIKIFQRPWISLRAQLRQSLTSGRWMVPPRPYLYQAIPPNWMTKQGSERPPNSQSQLWKSCYLYAKGVQRSRSLGSTSPHHNKLLNISPQRRGLVQCLCLFVLKAHSFFRGQLHSKQDGGIAIANFVSFLFLEIS